MISIDNQTEVKFDLEILEKITDELTEREVELVFVNSTYMHEINLEHRGKDATTDVLSFPLEDFPHFPLGSIVINSQMAEEKANELGHSLAEELTLMYIHGLLHILGFDHEIDSGKMREKEEEIITKHNLPNSLIVRTQS